MREEHDTESYKVVRDWCLYLMRYGDEVRDGLWVLTPTKLVLDLGVVSETKASGDTFDVVTRWLSFKNPGQARKLLNKVSKERTTRMAKRRP